MNLLCHYTTASAQKQAGAGYQRTWKLMQQLIHLHSTQIREERAKPDQNPSFKALKDLIHVVTVLFCSRWLKNTTKSPFAYAELQLQSQEPQTALLLRHARC